MKKKVMVSAIVQADLDAATYRPKDMDDYAKQLERAVKEFHAFIRDHRSMDWVYLSVVRNYEDQCEHCGMVWEESPTCCRKAIAEWDKELQLTPNP